MVPGSVAFSDRRILHVELQAPPVVIQKGPSTLTVIVVPGLCTYMMIQYLDC